MSCLSCQAKKHDEEEKEEHVEVAEGQELEVIPKNEEEEEQQDILLTEAISITPKRPKVAKTKDSVRSQHKEKTLATYLSNYRNKMQKLTK
jgi:hypothetical protein